MVKLARKSLSSIWMKYLHLLLFLCVASAAHAQISVSVSVKQRFHLLHEPVVATV